MVDVFVFVVFIRLGWFFVGFYLLVCWVGLVGLWLELFGVYWCGWFCWLGVLGFWVFLNVLVLDGFLLVVLCWVGCVLLLFFYVDEWYWFWWFFLFWLFCWVFCVCYLVGWYFWFVYYWWLGWYCWDDCGFGWLVCYWFWCVFLVRYLGCVCWWLYGLLIVLVGVCVGLYLELFGLGFLDLLFVWWCLDWCVLLYGFWLGFFGLLCLGFVDVDCVWWFV